MISVAIYFVLFVIWLASVIALWIGLSDLPKAERASLDWLIFALWPISFPLLFLYDALIWARRKWAVRNRNRG